MFCGPASMHTRMGNKQMGASSEKDRNPGELISLSLPFYFSHSFFFSFYFSFTGNRIPPPPPGLVCVCIYTGAAAARFQEKKVKIIIRNETSGSDSKSFLNKNWPSPSPFFGWLPPYSCVFGFKRGKKIKSYKNYLLVGKI